MKSELPETRFMRVLNLIDMLNPDRIIGESGKKELDGFGLGPRLKEFYSIWQEMKRDAENRIALLKKMTQN